MNQSFNKEERKHIRFNHRTRILCDEYRTSDGDVHKNPHVKFTVINISETGLGIIVNMPLENSATLKFELMTEIGFKIIETEVKWCQLINGEYHAGLTFKQLNNSTISYIYQLVTHLNKSYSA